MLESAKRVYWEAGKKVDLWREALLGPERSFRGVVLEDHLRRGGALVPIPGETAARSAAAADWLVRAQDATPDGGVSYGYFPATAARGWDISYPETTGYIMTSLVAYAGRAGRPELVERARRMAQWEADVQMANGAVQGGKLAPPDRQTAASFNTGMVLDGWVSVLENAGLENARDPAIGEAAERAAAFLADDLNERGLFRTNGAYVAPDAVKIYNVLCAWALYRFGRLTGQSRYQEAAVNAVEGALRFQAENGWFADNCLTEPLRPLTHTIGYTAQGVLEVGVLAGREDFIAAAERCYAPLSERLLPNGYLPGRFDAQWRPAVRWSCLTGTAQMAIVGYRLSELRGRDAYGAAADRMLDLLKALQRIDSDNPGIRGALAGSYPVLGDYMTGGYPNWATKYLLDALMLQAARSGTNLGAADPESVSEPA